MHYQYVLVIVAGLSVVDKLDFKLQAKVGAGFLPRIRVAPAEHLSITAAQVREFFRPY